MAQEKFSILTGNIIGIRARLWLDVESEKDKAIFNFRSGPRRSAFPIDTRTPGKG